MSLAAHSNWNGKQQHLIPLDRAVNKGHPFVIQNVKVLCEHGQLKEALCVLQCLQQCNTKEYVNACGCLLLAYSREKSSSGGKYVHCLLVKFAITPNIFLSNTIINLYAKCGMIKDARHVFETTIARNVFTWTSLITGYVQHGDGKEALNLYENMQENNVKPDKVTFISVVNACARVGDIKKAQQVHADIQKAGYESDIVVSNALIDVYSKCGSTKDAHQVFNKMSSHDSVSWSTLISAYAQDGNATEAFSLYCQMQQKGFKPSNFTFVSLLSSCACDARGLELGEHVHLDILESGCEVDAFVGCALVDMYGKCGCINKAREVFEKIRSGGGVVIWNAMVAGYARHGYGYESLLLFLQMQCQGLKPDEVTYVSVLSGCTFVGQLNEGKYVHAHVLKAGCESQNFVCNALIDMYAKCGAIQAACKLFEKMSTTRDTVSWNTIIAGLIQHEECELAINLFKTMQQHEVNYNKVTLVSILSACADISNLQLGRLAHISILRNGYESDAFVCSSLVDMYAKCGSITDAQVVFNMIPLQDRISWNAMINGYVQNDVSKEAFELYGQMQRESICPNEMTFMSILNACAITSALVKVREVHAKAINIGCQSDASVGSALVDAYANCGSIKDACQVFDSMPTQGVVSWNAMLAGYAQHGEGKEVLQAFFLMQSNGVKPNSVSLVCLLSACSHACLLEEGCHLFNSISQGHGVTPEMQHYSCMVDLLCRTGCVYEAEELISTIPFEPNVVVWMPILNACSNHWDVQLAERTVHNILRLEPWNASAFVLLSNIYATTGSSQYDVKRVEQMCDYFK